jgi:hypothetical protein
MWRVDNEHISPFDQPLQDGLGARGLQIECDAALITVSQVPGVGILRLWLRRDLVPMSPEISRRRLHFDDIGTKIGKDDRSSRTCDEARQVDYLEAGENIVGCHSCYL